MTIRYERGVLVTPAMAKKWLGQNAANNRGPKTAKIPMYARDMLLGRWQSDTGETIKFTPDGDLIDGANRLRAVQLAGSGVKMGDQLVCLPEGAGVMFDVAYDVPVEAMQVIDTGAARTAADALKIANMRERMRGSAIVRWALLWDQGIRLGSGGSWAPTTSEVLARFLAEPGAFDAATARGTDVQAAGLGTGSAAGMGFYLFAKLNIDEAHEFFDQLVTGANLPGRSPVLTLRNKLARVRVDRLTRAEQLGYLIKTWNNVRAGQTPSTMFFKDKLTSENFPTPR